MLKVITNNKVLQRTLGTFLFATVILAIFIFLRFNNIGESLYFQNDMGRDFLILYDWQQTGKPPLLGPQTNFVPFNQSAFYFYFFYPLFILTNHSFFTTNSTLGIMYIVAFLAGLFMVRKNSQLVFMLLCFSALVAIHPQLVLQHRYVWNPSFVVLFLSIGYFFFIKLQRDFEKKYLFLFSMSVALAVGMSVSAVPALIAFLLLAVVLFHRDLKKILQILFWLIIGHSIVFFPYILFELKYDFQIISRLFAQGITSPATEAVGLQLNLTQLSQLLLPSVYIPVLAIILLLSLPIILTKGKCNFKSLATDQSVQLVFLFIVTTTIVVIAPVNIEAHYIFAPLTFLLLLISALPTRYAIFLICCAAVLWLKPDRVTSYFTPAPRSIVTTTACFSKFCSNFTSPTFVSVQSNFHNYHYGPEFRYLMKNYGCAVKNIEIDPTAATLMTVVADGGEYLHGQTSYQELTMFGKSEQVASVSCSDKLSIYLLSKVE